MVPYKEKEEITHICVYLHTFYTSAHSRHVLTIASKCGIYTVTCRIYHNADLKMGEPNSFPKETTNTQFYSGTM